ncbi:hypothetical protein C8F04DRAFT_1188451 [Mycena alexandri]|uniref:Uncharacterized protein n=1 Tax=Mycena alexandri TaxID=1745969 RepID=A0AAD6X1C6_9AGAR|nr:hypothetical protein C8F04DRAFT_1188451 [Mycena alexandri]
MCQTAKKCTDGNFGDHRCPGRVPPGSYACIPRVGYAAVHYTIVGGGFGGIDKLWVIQEGSDVHLGSIHGPRGTPPGRPMVVEILHETSPRPSPVILYTFWLSGTYHIHYRGELPSAPVGDIFGSPPRSTTTSPVRKWFEPEPYRTERKDQVQRSTIAEPNTAFRFGVQALSVVFKPKPDPEPHSVILSEFQSIFRVQRLCTLETSLVPGYALVLLPCGSISKSQAFQPWDFVVEGPFSVVKSTLGYTNQTWPYLSALRPPNFNRVRTRSNAEPNLNAGLGSGFSRRLNQTRRSSSAFREMHPELGPNGTWPALLHLRPQRVPSGTQKCLKCTGYLQDKNQNKIIAQRVV